MSIIDNNNVIVKNKNNVSNSKIKNGVNEYINPEQLSELMSKNLSKIFIASYKKKIQKELEKFKEECKLS